MNQQFNLPQQFNLQNIIRYLIMFVVVTASTKVIPTCGVLKEHAIYVGLIGSSTLALLDMCYPNYVIDKKNNSER